MSKRRDKRDASPSRFRIREQSETNAILPPSRDALEVAAATGTDVEEDQAELRRQAKIVNDAEQERQDKEQVHWNVG